jgi:hypothetical protein
MEIFASSLRPSRLRRCELWLSTLLVGILFFLQACAPKPLYYWGGYDQCVYDYYYNTDPEKAYAILSETVTNAEKNNLRLAPGLCAEYGFLLYQRGEMAQAAQFFQKEAIAFPESAVLMNNLIAHLKQREATETAGQPEPEKIPAQPIEPSGGKE